MVGILKRNCIYEIEREESISKTVGILKRNCRYEIEREESHGLQAGTTSTKLNGTHEEQKGYVDVHITTGGNGSRRWQRVSGSHITCHWGPTNSKRRHNRAAMVECEWQPYYLSLGADSKRVMIVPS